MQQQRFIITTIDDIVRMLADYCGAEDVPDDARPLTLQYSAANRGKLSIIIDSDSLTSNEPLEIRFDMRKSFLV